METRNKKKRRATTTTLDIFAVAKEGDLAAFDIFPENMLRNARDRYENSVLSTAGAYGQLECCKLICNKCPSLLYHKNVFGTTALARASFVGKDKIVKFLIDASAEVEEKDAEDIRSGGGEKLLTMTDNKLYSALHLAVQKEHLKCVQLLVNADENYELLRMVDSNGDTAMHLAAKMRKFQLVESLIKSEKAGPEESEITHMDLPFDYFPNVSGETPLLIAFDDASSSIHSESEKILNLLLKKQPRQCRVHMGARKYTLLHYAASKGNLSVIQTIIQLCRESTEDVDIEGQNFLHLATKCGHIRVISFVLSADDVLNKKDDSGNTPLKNLSIADEVLNKKDNYGNTPLHVAAFSGNRSLALPLLYSRKVHKTVKNNSGQRAVDVINFDYDKIKAGVQHFKGIEGEKEIKNQREFDLVVGALIATVSFAAGITVPGGHITDGPNKGTAILSGKLSFKIFTVFDTLALLLSLYAVFAHFSVKHSVSKKDVFGQLKVADWCLLGALLALVAAFISGLYAVLAGIRKFAIVIGVFCICFFCSVFFTLLKVTLHHNPKNNNKDSMSP